MCDLPLIPYNNDNLFHSILFFLITLFIVVTDQKSQGSDDRHNRSSREESAPAITIHRDSAPITKSFVSVLSTLRLTPGQFLFCIIFYNTLHFTAPIPVSSG